MLGDAPPLEALGLGPEARAWAERLVREVGRLGRGEITLADLPRGALLAGPPGTGKTIYAQSVSLAAALPIVATSVGAWMGRRDLGMCIEAMASDFARARARLPAVLFVDEIDALVDPEKEAGMGKSWWMSFRSALLAATDGATSEPGLVLMGACNHVHLVDAALRRPGRLDRVLPFRPPDEKGLAIVLRTHLGRELPRADLRALSRLARGATGADVARAVRDARTAARDAGRRLRTADLLRALVPPDARPLALQRTIAVHESGHAIAAVALDQALGEVSIVGTGTSGGRAAIGLADALSREALERAVVVLLAGRAADVVIGGAPLGNAVGDLSAATELLADAHARLGLGTSLVSIADPARTLAYDARLRRAVEADMARLWEAATALIETERAAVLALACALLRRRIVDGEEVRRIRAEALRPRGSRKAPPPP